MCAIQKGNNNLGKVKPEDFIVINSPEELRRLRSDQLPAVCAELRDTLIRSLSVNPGHFASSMGAVDLTVALHYVFNTPYDRIVWDVGHQAYAHKLLTGRRDRFDTNRKLGGLCGFPTPSESQYDTFTAGHASNSISAALGMAVASAMKEDEPRRNVVAVIGDASIGGGLAFEGLNNAANTPNNLLIILNDNEMSIDNNVGSLKSYLAGINTSKRYNKLRYKGYRLLRNLGLVSDSRRGSIIRFNNSIKSLLSHQQNIFEGLNIRYFGPIDGNDVEKVVRVLRDIKDMEGPRLLHIRTTKGCGYTPAEKEPSLWHAPGCFDPATGHRSEDTPDDGKPPKWQDIFGETLVELARSNPKIIGITAAMLSGTSVSKLQDTMPDRVFDVGISEGHAVTFAGGLAKDGMLPYCAIYSAFLQRAYDHIIHDVAIQGLPVVFCIDRAGLVGEDGVTHHGLYDLAYLRTIPGMTIASPADVATLRDLMFTAQHAGHPMAIRYPRGRSNISGDWHTPMQPIKIGQGRRLKAGTDAVVLSIGPIADDVAKAIESAERSDGLSIGHYDMIFLKPIDENLLREAAETGAPILTVEDASRNGGLGSAVVEWLNDHGYRNHVTRIGVPDKFIAHGTVAQLREICGMDTVSISDAIKAAVLTKRVETTS
ncbi:MAG: 1-deoxy-D-xylulose-5-phosphate synthase [Muribaculaceae bacterium]|nr:1-deoxy-D-xylulose-5-phosphate synthase [Muribaculaceae bacterium]